MSFKTTLTIGYTDIDVLECISELKQVINANGRVATGVRGGDIRLILRGSTDSTIPAWALDPNKKQDGEIVFYKEDGESKFREIKFDNAYITWFAESFHPPGQDDTNFTEPMVFEDDIDKEMFDMIKKAHLQFGADYLMLCKISAEKISIDNVTHNNNW